MSDLGKIRNSTAILAARSIYREAKVADKFYRIGVANKFPGVMQGRDEELNRYNALAFDKLPKQVTSGIGRVGCTKLNIHFYDEEGVIKQADTCFTCGEKLEKHGALRKSRNETLLGERKVTPKPIKARFIPAVMGGITPNSEAWRRDQADANGIIVPSAARCLRCGLTVSCGCRKPHANNTVDLAFVETARIWNETYLEPLKRLQEVKQIA